MTPIAIDEISRVATPIVSVLLLLAGLALLRSAWARQSRAPVRVLVGWTLVVFAIACATQVSGEVGLINSLAAVSVISYAVIAAGVEVRTRRVLSGREFAAEPEERPTNWTRAIGKSLLAIVLAGVAAVGIGIAFAVVAPLHPVDRILIGGLLVPMLWGAGMAWTLCDAKLLRATLLLVVVSLCAYGLAFFPKIMSS